MRRQAPTRREGRGRQRSTSRRVLRAARSQRRTTTVRCRGADRPCRRKPRAAREYPPIPAPRRGCRQPPGLTATPPVVRRANGPRIPSLAGFFGSHREVLCFRVMDDQCIRRLLRVELILLREPYADTLRLELLNDCRAVFQIGARRIAEGVPRSTVSLVVEDFPQLRVVRIRNAQLLPDAPMPEFRQRFRQLDRQSMDLQIVTESAVREQPCGECTDPRAYCHELKSDDVGLPAAGRPEEIRDAQPPPALLAREPETAPLGPAVVGENDEVVTLGDAAIVAVDDAGGQQILGLQAVKPLP